MLAYEPAHDNKTNKMTCEPGHPPSLIRVRCPYEETLGSYLSTERTAKTRNQTG